MQKARAIELILGQCRASVVDGGPTLTQYWFTALLREIFRGGGWSVGGGGGVIITLTNSYMSYDIYTL